jgi:hypothetical protein
MRSFITKFALFVLEQASSSGPCSPSCPSQETLVGRHSADILRQPSPRLRPPCQD